MSARERIHIYRNKATVWLRASRDEGVADPVEECVLDTGCRFDLVISPGLAQCLKPLSFECCRDIRFPDGTLKGTIVYLGEICWLSEWREVAVTVMDPCPDALLGFPLLKQTRIVLDEKDAYVEALGTGG